jgi:hypothetical protein
VNWIVRKLEELCSYVLRHNVNEEGLATTLPKTEGKGPEPAFLNASAIMQAEISIDCN